MSIRYLTLALFALGGFVTAATQSSEESRLLTSLECAAIQGADEGGAAACTHRWYTHTCNNLDSNSNADSCGNPCSGSCQYCAGGHTINFCASDGTLNVRNCSITNVSGYYCGDEMDSVCHTHNGECQCAGSGTSNGSNCNSIKLNSVTKETCDPNA